MAPREGAEGEQHEVLGLPVLELPAREDQEPFVPGRPLGAGARPGMEERVVDPLQHGGRGADAMGVERGAVPGRSRDDQAVSPRPGPGRGIDLGALEEDGGEVGPAAEVDAMGRAQRREVGRERAQHGPPERRLAARMALEPGLERARLPEERAEPRGARRVEREPRRVDRGRADRRQVRVLRPVEREVQPVDAPAVEARGLPLQRDRAAPRALARRPRRAHPPDAGSKIA
jgi:hypothetical protein